MLEYVLTWKVSDICRISAHSSLTTKTAELMSAGPALGSPCLRVSVTVVTWGVGCAAAKSGGRWRWWRGCPQCCQRLKMINFLWARFRLYVGRRFFDFAVDETNTVANFLCAGARDTRVFIYTCRVANDWHNCNLTPNIQPCRPAANKSMCPLQKYSTACALARVCVPPAPVCANRKRVCVPSNIKERSRNRCST